MSLIPVQKRIAAVCVALGLLLSTFGHAAPRERVGTGGIRVNQIRNYTLTEQTAVSIDGVTVGGPVTRERVGTGGMRVRAAVVAGNATLTTGELTVLEFDNHTRGPVTQLDPLAVLGQIQTVTADTVLENFSALVALQPGDMVESSAVLDVNGTAIATRIKYLPNGANRWKLVGRVNALDTGMQTARIGEQQVSLAGLTPVGCAPLAVGSSVDARAVPVAGFVPGQVLALDELRCLATGTAGTPGAVGAVEGSIAVVDSATQFQLAGLTVQHAAGTQFRFGNAADLDVGVRLEVEGTYLSATTLSAAKIRFVRPRIRIEAPAVAIDVVPGTSIRLLDEVFLDNPQVRDEDALLTTGLGSPRQLEVRAYADSAGNLYATRARIRRNDPRPTEIVLAGPVQQIAPPQFRILGITVRSGPATQFRDRGGQVLSAEAFFAALTDGMVVEAEDASYNSTTRELDPTLLQLGDDPIPAAVQAAGASAGLAAGSADQIELDAFHLDGFE